MIFYLFLYIDLMFSFLLPSAMEYQANVISSQPQITVKEYTVSTGLTDWSTNVCDCCEDCGICTCSHADIGRCFEVRS